MNGVISYSHSCKLRYMAQGTGLSVMMITKVSSGLSKLLAGRFRGCDRFYAVRQFYAKAIFVMDGLSPDRGGTKVME